MNKRGAFRSHRIAVGRALRTSVAGLVLLAALLTAISCPRPSVTSLLMRNDFAIVREGRYPGTLRIKEGDTRIAQVVSRLREQLESDPGLLTRVGQKYFCISDTARFQYKTVFQDSTQHHLVLRYFARAPKPVVHAGWQLQLVFAEPDLKLVAVWASEVPLEE
ncbi:MAG: hypothetical protein ABIK62_02120 [candidate division WOR-3 bacterium]